MAGTKNLDAPSPGPTPGDGDRPRQLAGPGVPLDTGASRYVDLFENAPVGLVVVERGGHVVHFNRRAARILGPGIAFDRLLVTFAAPGYRERLAAAMTTPESASPFEIELAGDGAFGARHAVVDLWRDPSGDDTVLVALTENTESHRAEAEVRHAHDLLELCHRVARSGAWDCDPQRGTLWLSDAARSLLGVGAAAQATVESAFACFVDEPARAHARRAFAAAVGEGRAFDCEARVAVGGGAPRWLRIVGAPQRDGDRVLRVLGTVQDVEDRLRAEQARLAQWRAEAAARESAALLARFGHEFRTALQAMRGYTHLLARDPALQPSASAAARVARIDAAARSLLDLVDDLKRQPAAAVATPGRPDQAGVAGETTAPALRTVVYIEDNAVSAELMVALLEARSPLRVEIATDGASGVDAVRRLRPALVLVDLRLPDIDGLEVWRRLQADPATAGIPCIGVSASASEAEIGAALASGMSELLAKPIDAVELLAAVDRLVPGLTVVG